MKAGGTIAITMAGLGSRFRDAGYDRPKYEIEVLGRPLFDWAMLSLRAFAENGWSFSFAALRSDDAGPFIRKRAEAIGLDIGTFVELDGLTDGQATTALQLAVPSAADLPFAVFNIDTFVRPDVLRPDAIAAGASGWIPCFPGPGDGWSFAKLGADGAVVELREKQRISDHATLGLYWFESAASYRRLYTSFFASGAGLEKGERYIAPMYNMLIDEGRLVTIAEVAIDDVGMLGTPQQVEQFTANPPAGARDLIK